jgi:hypothetical protein
VSRDYNHSELAAQPQYHRVSRHLGTTEQSDFNPIEFDGIRKQAGLNSLSLRQTHLDELRVQRLQKLNAVAIRQMQSLTGSAALIRLANLKGKGGNLK